MAREILFRGISEKTKQWVFGGISSNCTKVHGFKIIPNSVGQFTGLTDKNGVKIFEGDVVDCKIEYEGANLPHRGVVVYNNSLSCFCTRNEAGETPLLKHLINTRVVVGNVFENPELLEPENKKAA